jgi:hypothetical protein
LQGGKQNKQMEKEKFFHGQQNFMNEHGKSSRRFGEMQF